MRIPAPNFTQAPNELFDEWLPKLSHVQLKVLMVILRKTFGWHKIRDRISLTQLEKFTGAKRQAIISATKRLQSLGLILKEVEGKNGEQETYYELIVIEDSNNFNQCDQNTPPSVIITPTKETLTKEKKKESNKEKKTPRSARPTATTKITLSKEKRCFEGISLEDRKAWRDKFTAVNLDKELGECIEWAMATPRDNYRKSILTWLRNCQKNHTTPFSPKVDTKIDVLEEDVVENMRLAKEWEKEYETKKMRNYELYARPTNILFVFPNNDGDLLSYEMPKEEFNKRCRPFLTKLKID